MLDEELNLIKDEYKNSQDYRIFILRYHAVEQAEVQYLVAEANWKQANQEQDSLKYADQVKFFIKKYKTHALDSVKHLVLTAMLVYIQYQKPKFSHFEFNEHCNDLLEYANHLDPKNIHVCEALVYVYWFKAQAIQDKDYFKAQHFYKKVLNIADHLNNDEGRHYQLRTKIALMSMNIRMKRKDILDIEFYELIDICLAEDNHLLQLELKNLIHDYINLHFDVSKQIQDEDQILMLNKYISTHESLKKNLLSLHDLNIDQEILLKISYFYWIYENIEISQEFILAYFDYCGLINDMRQKIQNNYYHQPDQKIIFADFVQQCFEKYSNLKKYRQMFNAN